MQPNPLNYLKIEEDVDEADNYYCSYNLGELNEVNRLHGRGIALWHTGNIAIGYYENGDWTGNFIEIYSSGYL